MWAWLSKVFFSWKEKVRVCVRFSLTWLSPLPTPFWFPVREFFFLLHKETFHGRESSIFCLGISYRQKDYLFAKWKKSSLSMCPCGMWACVYILSALPHFFFPTTYRSLFSCDAHQSVMSRVISQSLGFSHSFVLSSFHQNKHVVSCSLLCTIWCVLFFVFFSSSPLCF